MVRKGAPPPPDLLIAELADRQHGTVERVQLAALGLTAGAVDKRVQRGRLFPMHRGVYAVGRRGLNVRGHWMAAVLALGGGAVLSHRAAAALWGLREPPTGRIDVTVPSPSGRKRRRDIAVHRSATMAAHHVTSRDRIPVTTVPRTLLDLAAVEPRRTLERALDEAERLRLLDLRGLQAILGDSRGRRGTTTLLSVLQEHTAGSTLTRSELEERFLALCREHGLPPPRVNAWVAMGEGGIEADFLWPSRSLIVEVDGFASHATRKAFESDRRRDRRVRLAGYQPLRFTWREVTETPAAVAAELRAHLQIS
ncbi:MAG: type IV toxin-antitoxin system AbiEi family antitoxin domain-containing protein [Actinomycetota bacterium]